MGSSRKRPRTQPPAVDSPSDPPEAAAQPSPALLSVTDGSVGAVKTEAGASTPQKDSKTEGATNREIRTSGSWYGTWPRKSTPSTHVAKEIILADKQSAGSPPKDLSPLTPKKTVGTRGGRPSSMTIGKGKETSDITMGGTLEAEQAANKESFPQDISTPKENATIQESKQPEKPTKPENDTKSEDASSVQAAELKSDALARPATSSGWLGGWLGKHASSSSETPGAPSSDQKQPEEVLSRDGLVQSPLSKEAPEPVTIDVNPKAEEIATTSTSWFGLWATAAPSTAGSSKKQTAPKTDENDPDTVMTDAPEKPATEPASGSSWAFWSVESSKKTSKPSEATKDIGELAVTGEASQNKPEPAKAIEIKEDKKTKSNKRGRPVSTEYVDESANGIQPQTPPTKSTPSQSPAPAKVVPTNLLMPSVKSTYSLMENPSILQQLTRLLLRAQQKPVKHVYLSKDRPKIKKALAIGVHGLFPAALLRTVIGQPTGTSIKFANHAAAAIRRWGDLNGCVDCEIEKVALEGEGKIADRVDNLWKLLLNWIDHIRKADFIMVACHSQGVPVAVMLVAKLIEFGVVSTTRIAVCAMAGVSLGPFPEYRSRFTMFSPASSATELFEFAEPQSAVSKRYEDALRITVKYGARITYCGSIDDQLISMESSIFSPVSHPYIYRAVFVDGRIHAPNFLSHLIGFALKLRNLGVSDHGLIRELSAPLAGSLYTGEGHSRLYDDDRVYDLALEFALETTAVGEVPLDVQEYHVPTNANPYVLPWIMRGLLEEDFVKTELDAEVTELLKQFDEWKPTTKVLKDVKYRLEAVRSKL